MHHYGMMARQHWARWLPERYTAIPDPDSFFTDLGEEAARQIADLALDLAGQDPDGEDYLVKLGRLNMARLQAEEIVLREQILLPPEPGTAPDEDSQDSESQGGQARGTSHQIPLIISRDHPLWEQVNAEQQDLA